MESHSNELFFFGWTIFFFIAMMSVVFGYMCADAVKRDREQQ